MTIADLHGLDATARIRLEEGEGMSGIPSGTGSLA
jgi:hypothetical protein